MIKTILPENDQDYTADEPQAKRQKIDEKLDSDSSADRSQSTPGL